MKSYQFKATNLIASGFEKREIKYGVIEHDEREQLLAGFGIENGPKVMLRFITDGDNDTAVRLFGLLSNVPEEKRMRAIEACNLINTKVRHFKFVLDKAADVNMEYDLLLHSSDDSLAEMAFEVLMRAKLILDDNFAILSKAVYTDEDIYCLPKSKTELLRRIGILSRLVSQAVDEAEVAKALENSKDDAGNADSDGDFE